LPFSVNDDGLYELFKDFTPKTAHVHYARFGARSRGYGFVEFANEQDQQNAINKMNGFEVHDGSDKPPRQISVVVSHSVPFQADTQTQQTL
jgi:RNA recognition motif-containing protein